MTTYFSFQCEERTNQWLRHQSCEEVNAAMLPPINQIFLLKGSLSVLVGKVSQQITITQGEVKELLQGSCFFSAFICFSFPTRFTHQTGHHGQSAALRASRIAAAAVYHGWAWALCQAAQTVPVPAHHKSSCCW